MPSLNDIFALHGNPYERTMIIAQTDQDTGKVLGYLLLRKIKEMRRLSSDEIDEFQKYLRGGKLLENRTDFEQLTQLCNFRYKAVPVDGSRFDKEKFLFEDVA